MSGICGIYQRRGAPADDAALAAMLDAGAHRGPDGSDAWVRDSVGLGHLALFDAPEDRQVRQPLVEDDLAVVADARIDNREDLLRILHLEGAGPIDSARLILAAYRHWGLDFAAHLIGDFAFALWDGAKRHLLLARDPMSMRPLYYHLTDARLIFASETAQLLTVPGVPVELDELTVAAHLTYQPISLERSFYRGIAQLSPGHAILIEQGRSRVWRYWDIDPAHRIRYRNDDDYAAHFREIFKDATRARLRSDHPVGLMLSGGVDSSAIAATGGWLLKHEPAGLGQLRTYSYAFEKLRDCDERAVSGLITDHYDLPAIGIPADDACPFSGYPADGPARDAPDWLIYQTLEMRLLTRARAEGVTTMMSGHRGDLQVGMFYDPFAYLRAGLWQDVESTLGLRKKRWRHAAGVIRRQLLAPAVMAWGPGALSRAIERKFWHQIARQRRMPPYPAWLSPDFAARVELGQSAAPPTAPAAIRDPSVRLRHEGIFMAAHARIATESDRTYGQVGMLHSDPWSDRRITQFILAIPQDQVTRPSHDKRLARRAMKDLIPQEARRQVGKVSLMPLANAALNGGAHDAIIDLTTRAEVVARGYVTEDGMQKIRESALGGVAENGIWEILNLEIWLRRYWR